VKRDISTSALQVVAFAGAGALSPSIGAVSASMCDQSEHGGTPGVRYGQREQGRLTADYFAHRLEGAQHRSVNSLRLQGGTELVTSRQLFIVNDVLSVNKNIGLRIDQLARDTSVEGWDDEGGHVVTAAQWQNARRIASRIMLEMIGVPAPFVSACGDGTAHLQWTTPSGDRGVIEIGQDRYWWSFLSSSGDGDEFVELCLPDEAFGKIRALFG